MSNATTSAILDNVRAALPGIADDVALQALFNVCDDLARETLRVAAPVNVDADPAGWLPVDQWVPNFQPLLAGVLASLYGQFAKPYFNPDLSKFHLDRYMSYRTLSRTTAAGAPTAVDTIPERIVSTVRAQIQLARDESIKLEMFNVVNKLRAEVYRLDPLKGSATDYLTWLSETQYEQSYLAILYGVLSRLYSQANMPWFNLELFNSNNVLFLQELDLARSSNLEPGGTIGGIEGLLEEAKAHLPGARDEVMRFELRRAMDEFFKVTQAWQEDIGFKVKPGKFGYEISPSSNAQIIRLIYVKNANDIVLAAAMPVIPIIQLQREPSEPGRDTVSVALSLFTGGSCGGCGNSVNKCCCDNWGIPGWILTRWNEVFFDGLLYRMMMQPQKPYTNTELGLYHGQRFRAGMADARGATKQQNLYDGQAWRFPAFA